ncbi:MAG TPA: tetratricopeptide repeat protein, partial [Blastocatellia bacterium]|nr:tetratricopeptide repeat protein [Blastocatellia bacterium]
MLASLLFITLVFLPAPLPQSTTTSQAANDVATRFNRAIELQRQGALQEAVAEYRALLAIAPNYAEAQANLGVVLARLGNYTEAIKAYEEALRLKPELTPILLNLGIAHYKAGQFAKAVEVLERVIVIAPNHTQARQLIGISLVELGRDADAIIYLEPALSSAQTEATTLYSLGLAYLRLHRSEVSRVVEQLASRSDGAALGHLLHGQALLEEFAFEKAAAEFESAAKLSTELPRLQFLRGLTAFKLGQSGQAREYLEAELKRTP